MTSLLLLHGLGATNGVWADVIAELDWPGRVIAPDLAGHGMAQATGDYTVGALAAAVATSCDNGEDVIAVGHSLGGGVALCLASGFFRPRVTAVVALGVKVSWTDDDVAAMAKVAAKGIRWFDTREEAEQRFLLQAGLAGIVDPGHPSVSSGVRQHDGQWCVAQDPETFAQKKLDMAALITAAQCPVILGAGADDAMVAHADLVPYTDNPRIADGCGHNVHVENPEWVASLITEFVA